METLKLFKVKSSNGNSINYEKDIYWYTNNYNMLGTEWLYDALRNKSELDKTFLFLSPSANIGKYEKETYNALIKDGYDPIFYLGDLHSGKLKDKVKEEKKLFWIQGEGTNASEIKIAPTGDGTIPKNVDVILDCKGAIWHSLNSRNADLSDVIEVLANYYNLLVNNEAKLLIDYEVPKLWRRIADPYIKIVYPSKKIRTRKIKMFYMSEYTTYYYLLKYVGKIITLKTFHPLHVEINHNRIKDKFDIAYCTKKDLKQYIEELKKITAKEYKWNIKKYKYLNCFYALCPWIPLLFFIELFCFKLFFI